MSTDIYQIDAIVIGAGAVDLPALPNWRGAAAK
jgi:hypothetical protein